MMRIHLVISGRVQGVYFRQSSLEIARSNSLDGWVRNRPDGTVELVAQGTREAIERLVVWCQAGPEAAQVTSIERTDAEPVLLPTGFHIRPTG